jgi:DNA-binding MarR family transcriptional regulator
MSPSRPSEPPTRAGGEDRTRVPAERYDLQILQSIRRIIRAVDLYSRKLRAQCDLTAPQLICLGTLAEAGPLTVTGIAQRVFLSPSTVVGILGRLENRGLVSRERDLGDRRVVNNIITEDGLAVMKQAPSALQDGLHGALLKLPRLEQATIALSLERVVDLMEAEQLDASPILATTPLAEEGNPSEGDR